jgi:hypothetical protein
MRVARTLQQSSFDLPKIVGLEQSLALKMPKELCSHNGCTKKLTLTSIQCKCEKKYCMGHRHPEDHACSYDFKGDGKRELLKFMSTAVTAKKVEVI